MKLLLQLARFTKRLLKSLINIFMSYNLKNYLKHRNVEGNIKSLVLKGKTELTISPSARIYLGEGVTLSNCKIFVDNNSELFIGSQSTLSGGIVSLKNGASLKIGQQVLIEKMGSLGQSISLNSARCEIEKGSRIRCSITAQYDGEVRIGEKTFINEGTEIRCDQKVSIGKYTLISYEVSVFDTNTHSTDWRERRKAILSSPMHTIVGEPQPVSKPIEIGDDCWIGKKAVVLKGSKIGDRAIVGFGAIVTSSIPSDAIAYGNPARWKENTITKSVET